MATMGRRRRSALRASFWRVNSFSRASSALRASSHCALVATFGRVMNSPLQPGASAVWCGGSTLPPAGPSPIQATVPASPKDRRPRAPELIGAPVSLARWRLQVQSIPRIGSEGGTCRVTPSGRQPNIARARRTRPGPRCSPSASARSRWRPGRAGATWTPTPLCAPPTRKPAAPRSRWTPLRRRSSGGPASSRACATRPSITRATARPAWPSWSRR